MTKTVEFYYDFGSPTCYLAFYKLRQLEEEGKLKIEYCPILLGGIFKTIGNSAPANIPAKGKYMFQDIIRYAKRYGFDYNFNPHFPINTLSLMRSAVGMLEDARFVELNDVLFKAVWRDQKNMGDPETAKEVIEKGGFDVNKIFALSTDQRVKDELKERTVKAVERGLFGAPTMFLDNEMFWGQDRIFMIEELL
ncbi:2-hydroxychromene-2-carboxylate isomerase [Bacteriovoracales bacterium]|nr:2-hydroxychromene-2-carboxylate isomerase [Bacteriovoracales bacterium]